MDPAVGGTVLVYPVVGDPTDFIIRLVTSTRVFVSPPDDLDQVSSISLTATNEWKVDGAPQYRVEFPKFTPNVRNYLDLQRDIEKAFIERNDTEINKLIEQTRTQGLYFATILEETFNYTFYNNILSQITGADNILILNLLKKHNLIDIGYLLNLFIDSPDLGVFITWMNDHGLEFSPDDTMGDKELLRQFMVDSFAGIIMMYDKVNYFAALSKIPGLFDFLNPYEDPSRTQEWLMELVEEYEADKIRDFIKGMVPPKATRKA